MDEDSENSQLMRLMARHTQLRDLLDAHHLIGTNKQIFYYFVFCIIHPFISYLTMRGCH